jgi:sulfur carrier protein ThiS
VPKLIYRNKEWEVPAGTIVREAIQQAGLDPDLIMAVRGRKVVLETTPLKAEDVIKLVPLVAGG